VSPSSKALAYTKFTGRLDYYGASLSRPAANPAARRFRPVYRSDGTGEGFRGIRDGYIPVLMRPSPDDGGVDDPFTIRQPDRIGPGIGQKHGHAHLGRIGRNQVNSILDRIFPKS